MEFYIILVIFLIAFLLCCIPLGLYCRHRHIVYKKQFFDANGIKISNKYIKDINEFLDIISNYDNCDIITEKLVLKLEDLYKRIFKKGVNIIYKFDYVIDFAEDYEKSYIDKIMKQIKSNYEAWQRFNSAKEIY